IPSFLVMRRPIWGPVPPVTERLTVATPGNRSFHCFPPATALLRPYKSAGLGRAVVPNCTIDDGKAPELRHRFETLAFSWLEQSPNLLDLSVEERSEVGRRCRGQREYPIRQFEARQAGWSSAPAC